MAADGKKNEELAPSIVRDQLDEILAKEITSLLDVDSNSVMLSFNLTSISSITLIIEREREIRQFPESPPERYTKESFIKELIEIGLEKDGALDETINSVIRAGYISVGPIGQLKAEMPAFMTAGFLDNMFPGMVGMNLVAFVLQMNNEVNSGRKTLELAKESFASILKSRGVSVSKDKAAEKASAMVSGVVATSSKSKEISRKLKTDNLSRLSKLIKKRKKTGFDSPVRQKIKDAFDKGPSKEELEAQKVEIRKAEEEAIKAAQLAKDLAEKEDKIKEAQEAAKEAARQLEEVEKREKQLLEAQEEARLAEEKAKELKEKEALMAQKEAQLKALEEKLKQEGEQKLQSEEAQQRLVEEDEKKKVTKTDDDIESQIAAFESELTMPCPLCKEGEIVSKTTEKGKEFFSCTKSECRFVSWDKPYHFECPLCKNSFLTEIINSNFEHGLKCPRASCSYIQNNLLDPKQNMAQAAVSASPKKKKRVVRRKRR